MEIIPSILVHEEHYTQTEANYNVNNQRKIYNIPQDNEQSGSIGVQSSVIAFEHHFETDSNGNKHPINPYLNAPKRNGNYYWSNYQPEQEDSYQRPVYIPSHELSENYQQFRPPVQDTYYRTSGHRPQGNFRPSGSQYADFVDFIKRRRS
jgi:hypothetical protein